MIIKKEKMYLRKKNNQKNYIYKKKDTVNVFEIKYVFQYYIECKLIENKTDIE